MSPETAMRTLPLVFVLLSACTGVATLGDGPTGSVTTTMTAKRPTSTETLGDAGTQPTCSAGESIGCMTVCGFAGAVSCTAAGEWGDVCITALETCGNHVDDDCNGLVDDDDPACGTCTIEQVKPCQTSCGSLGRKSCTDKGTFSTTCEVLAEDCTNGVDDDCNGLADSADPACRVCEPNDSRACTTTCGSSGTQTCGSSGEWLTECVKPSEMCSNGKDDDCDGLVDAADPDCFVCTPSTTRSCTTSCGSTGHEGCPAGQWETTCQPPQESCGNGVDDDCDGLVDAADLDCFVCTPSTTRSCTTSCGSTGHEGCPAGQWETTCRPPQESCNNGVDDDCDGKVDGADSDCPPEVHTCEQADGNGCNGDMGYGDHCAASDNSGGCSATRFWAWCNRRNSAYPNIWYDYVQGWVTSRCDGVTTDNGQQYDTYSCTSSSNQRYECTTPLVLSFGAARVRFAASPASFAFTPGAPVRSDWVAPETPWLVRDLNANGQVDDGAELFGSNTRLPDGRVAKDGFEALSALDDNHDGVVDAKDTAFSRLLLWRDANGDKRSSPDELETLSAAGVRALSIRTDDVSRCDTHGNCERGRSAFSFTDARGHVATGAVIDVWLAVSASERQVCTR